MQAEILLFFQRIGTPFLDKIAVFITMFGNGLVPVSFILFMLWCVDKRKGFAIIGPFFLSTIGFSILKAIIRMPRPFTVISGLKGKDLASATGYSFPSGHTTNAATVYSALAIACKKRTVSVLCAVIIVLVGVSRMYLGVHWPMCQIFFCLTLRWLPVSGISTWKSFILPPVILGANTLASMIRMSRTSMGLSMGGYGTLKCALNSPSRYAGCAAFSAVTDIVSVTDNSNAQRSKEAQAIFGIDKIAPESCDVSALLKKSEAKVLPRFYLACGEQDSLFGQNEAFAALLQQTGADYLFEHWPGIHSWDFWDVAVKKAFDYFFSCTRSICSTSIRNQ